MKYAFFPGCTLKGTAAEAYEATVKVAERLGIKLTEIEGWTCCGATHLQDVDELTALAVNARNIALAEKMNLPILTACNTCTFMLKKAKAELDGGLAPKINKLLGKINLQYQGTSTITHLLWILANQDGLEQLKKNIKISLNGLIVAPFYGCHIIRPPELMDFEDYRNPRSLENLIQTVGAELVSGFSARTKCCGFHALFPAEKDVMHKTQEYTKLAATLGANCIVTPCPLCHMQLDIYQQAQVPVLHLAQFIGLALGLGVKELGIDRHVTRFDNIQSLLQNIKKISTN